MTLRRISQINFIRCILCFRMTYKPGPLPWNRFRTYYKVLPVQMIHDLTSRYICDPKNSRKETPLWWNWHTAIRLCTPSLHPMDYMLMPCEYKTGVLEQWQAISFVVENWISFYFSILGFFSSGILAIGKLFCARFHVSWRGLGVPVS